MRRISKLDISSLISWLYKDTILPEFLLVLGEAATMDILRIFGGLKISIPPYRKVLDLKRNIDIYESLCYVNSHETVKALAEKYDLTEVWVKGVFKSMKRQYPKIVKFLDSLNNGSNLTVTTKRKARHEDIEEVERTQDKDRKDKKEENHAIL